MASCKTDFLCTLIHRYCKSTRHSRHSMQLAVGACALGFFNTRHDWKKYKQSQLWKEKSPCFYLFGSKTTFFLVFSLQKWGKFVFKVKPKKKLLSIRPQEWLLHLHAGKAIASDFSHCHALITLYVQFLCSDWSKFYAENFCSVWKLAYW